MPATPSRFPQIPFGEMLRRLRVAQGLTQQLLAERSGLSVRGISDLERGARSAPQRETIRRLIAALALPEHDQALLAVAARREPRPRLVSQDRRWPLPVAAQQDAFIGRSAELTAILRALHSPGSNLLTLTGPPGVGKTRVALEAMRRLAALVPDEIVVVDLAPLTSPLLVLPTIAAAVGVRETGPGAVRDHLHARIASRPTVLVLDNFEHLLTAAPVVGDLLQASLDVRILVTSREPLHIASEQVLSVPPLSVPPMSRDLGARAAIGHDAVELFVLRARESDPGFNLSDKNAQSIANLCLRLDGLPLAIELAAARAPQLTPAAILERLEQRRPVLTAGRRDQPARQHTLANAIDWSYELLSAEEQRLWNRLSVFQGGFFVGAAESVAHAADNFDVAGSIASLADKSLLVRQTARMRETLPAGDEELGGESRFTMLATIREYGLERLAASGEEAAVQAAHARHFLNFSERASDDFNAGAGQPAAIGRLEQEHDNLRQALAHALEQDDPSTALRMTHALWRFWWIQGHLSEGQRWLARSLDQSHGAPPAARARALVAFGRLAWVRGEFGVAEQSLQQALALEPEPFDRCEALNALGDVARHQRRHKRAEAALSEAMDVARLHNDRFHLGASLHNLGTVALDRGEYDRARVALAAGLDIARQVGQRYLVNSSLHYLSWLDFAQGDYARSAALRQEELAVQQELAPASAHGAARFLEGVALLAMQQRQLAAAARLFGAAATLREGVEDVERVERALVSPWIATAREQLGAEVFSCAWTIGRCLPLDSALTEAADLLDAWKWTNNESD